MWLRVCEREIVRVRASARALRDVSVLLAAPVAVCRARGVPCARCERSDWR